MEDLARQLESPVVGRPIIDETGLTGHYDFKIHFHWAGRPTTDSVVPSDPAPSALHRRRGALG